MNIFQQFYNVSKIVKASKQYDRSAIKRLQRRFSDYRLDVRRIDVDGKPYWSLIRWEHPKKSLGKLGSTDGLFDLPVICYRWKKPDNEPREITIGDIDKLIEMPSNIADRSIDSMMRDFAQVDKDAKKLDDDFTAEVKPHLSEKSYGTGWMVDENERRVKEGLV